MKPREVAVLIVIAVGCTSKQPVLHPNEHLYYVGPEIAQADISACTRLAEEYVGSSAAADAAGRTATGAAVGGATGAAAGAVLGHAGRGAGAGAAGGAAGSFMRWVLGRRDPDPAVRVYVEDCLRERGYEPVGWR